MTNQAHKGGSFAGSTGSGFELIARSTGSTTSGSSSSEDGSETGFCIRPRKTVAAEPTCSKEDYESIVKSLNFSETTDIMSKDSRNCWVEVLQGGGGEPTRKAIKKAMNGADGTFPNDVEKFNRLLGRFRWDTSTYQLFAFRKGEWLPYLMLEEYFPLAYQVGKGKNFTKSYLKELFKDAAKGTIHNAKVLKYLLKSLWPATATPIQYQQFLLKRKRGLRAKFTVPKEIFISKVLQQSQEELYMVLTKNSSDRLLSLLRQAS